MDDGHGLYRRHPFYFVENAYGVLTHILEVYDKIIFRYWASSCEFCSFCVKFLHAGPRIMP